MVNESRLDIYDYLYGLFAGTVTENVYQMNEPQELTQSDTTDGFIVIRVGNIVDESEFYGEAYGRVRCYVECFVPLMSRGRLDRRKFKEFEDSVNDVIRSASSDRSGTYQIEDDGVVSMDAEEITNANNAYLTFIKSFIVNIIE